MNVKEPLFIQLQQSEMCGLVTTALEAFSSFHERDTKSGEVLLVLISL